MSVTSPLLLAPGRKDAFDERVLSTLSLERVQALRHSQHQAADLPIAAQNQIFPKPSATGGSRVLPEGATREHSTPRVLDAMVQRRDAAVNLELTLSPSSKAALLKEQRSLLDSPINNTHPARRPSNSNNTLSREQVDELVATKSTFNASMSNCNFPSMASISNIQLRSLSRQPESSNSSVMNLQQQQMLCARLGLLAPTGPPQETEQHISLDPTVAAAAAGSRARAQSHSGEQ